MSEQISSTYYMINTHILEASTFAENCHPTVPSLYEVIRIMDGIPLFLEEHYRRLVHSAETIHQHIDLSCEEFSDRIHRLIEANAITNHNIKVVLYDFEEGHARTTVFYFIPTKYPEATMYENGVPMDLFHAERKNPQAKIINQSLRDASNAYIREHDLYEVMLVNEQECITEGSRSNLFFIRNNSVYTAPHDGVLPGITMLRIIRLCQENEIPVVETPIQVSELASYDAAFISGTSPKVLPIRSVGELTLDVHNPLLRKIMALYDEEMRRYLLRSLA